MFCMKMHTYMLEVNKALHYSVSLKAVPLVLTLTCWDLHSHIPELGREGLVKLVGIWVYTDSLPHPSHEGLAY